MKSFSSFDCEFKNSFSFAVINYYCNFHFWCSKISQFFHWEILQPGYIPSGFLVEIIELKYTEHAVQGYNAVTLSKLTVFCNHHHCLILECYYHLKQKFNSLELSQPYVLLHPGCPVLSDPPC